MFVTIRPPGIRSQVVAVICALSLPAMFAPAPAQANNMMSACASDIANMCSDVSNGRGRITACLMANGDRLSAPCKPEVDALAQQSSTNRLIPASARQIFSPNFRATLPESCSADAASLCPGVPLGNGQVFACLYSRDNRVSSACSAATDTLLGN